MKDCLPTYRAVEDKIYAAIAARFALPNPMPPEIKKADVRLLATEVERFFRASLPDGLSAEPYPEDVLPSASMGLLPHTARSLFLTRFADLFSSADQYRANNHSATVNA